MLTLEIFQAFQSYAFLSQLQDFLKKKKKLKTFQFSF